jgi:hypothetical protein
MTKDRRNTKMKKGLLLVIVIAGMLGAVPPSFAHELA